jgi:hypothetical protein
VCRKRSFGHWFILLESKADVMLGRNNGNRNGVNIEQMFAKEDGQLKTQNQALEETVTL